MKPLSLDEIASTYHAGYVRRASDLRNPINKTTYSFCAGELIDVRINSKIIASLGFVMKSFTPAEIYYICDKYGNICKDMTPDEYAIHLGYSSK